MNQSMKTIVPLTALSSLAAALTALAASVDTSKLPPASDQKGLTYAKDIKPILDKSCVRCHGAERPKAGLRLDSLAGVLQGTKEGKVVKTGDSAQSLMIHATAQLGPEDHWMPPPGNKAGIAPLTKEQVGLIRAWIDQGAK
jgi:uncharacterized membrane protein